MINYLIIGVIFAVVLEYTGPFIKWNWTERVILVVLWPIMLCYGIYSFIKNLIKNS